MLIDVVIPAFNEENAIGKVIAEIPDIVRNIIVVNNNSNDDTRKVSLAAGAIVLDEPQKVTAKPALKDLPTLMN